MFPHKELCDIHTNGNDFLGFTMWDVDTNGNNWVSIPRQIAHELILPQPVSQEGLSPTVSGSCGKDPPYRPHSLGDGSKCRRGKGLKTVCIAPLCTSDIIKSYGNPSMSNKESLQSSYHGEHKMKLIVGHKTTLKLFFLINLLSYSYKCQKQPLEFVLK